MAKQVAKGIWLLELSEPSCNAYALECGALIDPGLSEEGELVTELEAAGLSVAKIKSILLTHAHADHSSNSRFFPKAMVYAHPAAARRLKQKEAKETAYAMFDVELPEFKHLKELKDGQVVELGGFKLKAVFSPGHTDDAVCFFDSESRVLFVGDTFFADGVPRIFNSGSREELLASWKKLETLEPRLVATGHGALCNDFKEELDRARKMIGAYVEW